MLYFEVMLSSSYLNAIQNREERSQVSWNNYHGLMFIHYYKESTTYSFYASGWEKLRTSLQELIRDNLGIRF